MQASTVIARFNIVKASNLHQIMRSKAIAVDRFILKAAEPNLSGGVFPVIALMAH